MASAHCSLVPITLTNSVGSTSATSSWLSTGPTWLYCREPGNWMLLSVGENVDRGSQSSAVNHHSRGTSFLLQVHKGGSTATNPSSMSADGNGYTHYDLVAQSGGGLLELRLEL
jgi:hypothetical protein